jgi:hypothetical protein
MDSKQEHKNAIEVSVIFHEGQRMFAVPKQPAPVHEDWGPGPHEYHSLPAPVPLTQNWFVRDLREYARRFHSAHLFPGWDVQRALKHLDAYATPPAAPVQVPVAYRVKWPAFGGGYKWVMTDKPTMVDAGFVNEALYTTPPAAPVQPVDLAAAKLVFLPTDHPADKTPIEQQKAFVLGWNGALELLEKQGPIYTTPPAAPAPLTDDQIRGLTPKPDGVAEGNVRRVEVLPGFMGTEFDEVDAWSMPLVLKIARAIEAAHGITAAAEKGN